MGSRGSERYAATPIKGEHRFGQIITQRADGPALEVFTPLGAAQAVAFNTEDNLIE
jgi:hypothetical protein